MNETSFHKETMDVLPNDLKIEVLCHLDKTSLVQMRLVSKNWRNLVDNERVWQSLFYVTFGVFEKFPEITWKEFFISTAGLHWNPIATSDQIKITNNNRTIKDICRLGSSYKWTSALATPSFPNKGKSYCEIEINKCCDSAENTIKIAFGVIDKQPELLYNCPFGYSVGGFSRPADLNSCCFMADGNFMLHSQPYDQTGTQWHEGDSVGMLIDRVNHTIQFYLNGEEQGASLYLDYGGDLFVAVSLISGNQVTISRFPQFPLLSKPRRDSNDTIM